MSIISEQGLHANSNHASFYNNSDRAELEALKAAVSFTALLRKDGIKSTASGTQARCLCPFHPESTPSFTVYDDQRGYCFGCGWNGDVLEYLKQRFNTDFLTAKVLLEELVEKGELATKTRIKPVVESKPASGPDPLRAIQRADAQCMAKSLHGAPDLCQQIAESRGWKTETIAALAAAGHLGWHNNSVAFLYDTGIKLRPWAWDREHIRWYCGKPYLWRSGTIQDAREVIIAEGETDAISLIDAGVCKVRRTVIAAPSATTFNSVWATAFAGKSVTICFDNDEAGQRGAQKVAEHLAPFAAEIFIIDWKEVRHV